jgi:molybdate transport system substrate-binding protein
MRSSPLNSGRWLKRLWRTGSLVLLFGTTGIGCTGDGPSPEVGRAGGDASRVVAVAAASDLKFALDEVIARFLKGHPDVDLKASYGSSGNFFAQLSDGAPFDLYLAADIDYPRRLIDAGRAEPDSLFLYAVGRLVVWVPNASPLDLEALGMRVVADPSVRKIAIANPRHAPYGRAAEAAMKTLGVYDAVKDRLVQGENIAQAAQFVESGSADVGILALSLAMAPAMRDKGRYWAVPLDAYPPLRQGGVILARTGAREATRLLKDFIAGPEGRAILARYGFVAPKE